MYKTSQNVLFVYSLLLIDLLINITDNLIPDQAQQNYYLLSSSSSSAAAATPATNQLGHGDYQQPAVDGGLLRPTNQQTYGNSSFSSSSSKSITSRRRSPITSSLTFSIFILQVLAIVCVVINLLLHFFNLSDQVRQSAGLRRNDNEGEKQQQQQQQLSKSSHARLHQHAHAKSRELVAGSCPERILEAAEVEPLPQRLALKLVLDRYWWSLLVGLSYLVLTIILQIIKIDPSWHRMVGPMVGGAGASPPLVARPPDYDEDRSDQEEEDASSSSSWSSSLDLISQDTRRNLLPILTVLTHKLMSTCYYVSFVVVYRAPTTQMVNRILMSK